MKMPFGKYEGMDVADVPLSYLRWLATTELYGKLRIEVETRLGMPPTLTLSVDEQVARICQQDEWRPRSMRRSLS